MEGQETLQAGFRSLQPQLSVLFQTKVTKQLQTHQNFVSECSLPLAWNRVVVAMWNSSRPVTRVSFLLRVLVQLVKQEILVHRLH